MTTLEQLSPADHLLGVRQWKRLSEARVRLKETPVRTQVFHFAEIRWKWRWVTCMTSQNLLGVVSALKLAHLSNYKLVWWSTRYKLNLIRPQKISQFSCSKPNIFHTRVCPSYRGGQCVHHCLRTDPKSQRKHALKCCVSSIGLCYGLNVCIPSKFFCWNPHPERWWY